MANGQWAGAIKFANGAIFFPNYTMPGGLRPGTFVMPDGTQIPNGPQARTLIDTDLHLPAPGSKPGDPVTNPVETPEKPLPGDPGPGGVPVPGPIGGPGYTPPPPVSKPPVPTPPGQTPGAQTPSAGGPNFDKGQAKNIANPMPGNYYKPTATTFPGQAGFNPYAGQNGTGGGGSLTGGLGAPTVYDPLGIGQNNYGGGPYPAGSPGSNQNVYSMTGANAATGYNGPLEEGVVGGQGGYGVGMVAPEYTGPQFDDPREVVKAMRRQQRLLNKPTEGVGVDTSGNVVPPTPLASGWGFNAANPMKRAFAQAGGTRDTWRALRGAGAAANAPAAGGTPAAGTPAAGTAAATGGQPPIQAPPQTVAQAGQGTDGPAGTGWVPGSGYVNGNWAGAGPGSSNWGGYDPSQPGMIARGDLYQTPYGELVTSSSGNAGTFQKVGDNSGDVYQYDPSHLGPGDDPSGWKKMTAQQYQGYGDHQYTDPFSMGQNAYKQAGGEFYQYGGTAPGAQTNAWQAQLQKSGLGLPPAAAAKMNPAWGNP